MGNRSSSSFEYGSNYGASHHGSIGDLSGHGSFGDAFREAHGRGGNGHTFEYNGALYSTNRADGSESRRAPDSRDDLNHQVRADFHHVNSTVKDAGMGSLDWTTGRSYKWSSTVDKQRADYHEREVHKQ